MVYNAITTEYAAYQAVAGQGVESAEIGPICDALAAMLLEVVGALPLTPPLRYAWGTAIQQVNVFPSLIVLPDTAGTQVSTAASSKREHVHALIACYLFGPATGDIVRMAAAGLPYLYATDLAIQSNKSLAGKVQRLILTGYTWGDVPYAGETWFGLVCRVQATAYYTMRTQ